MCVPCSLYPEHKHMISSDRQTFLIDQGIRLCEGELQMLSDIKITELEIKEKWSIVGMPSPAKFVTEKKFQFLFTLSES